MSKFRDKNRRLRCGLCRRKTDKLPHVVSAGTPDNDLAFIGRICRRCYDKLRVMPDSRATTDLVGKTLAENSSVTDAILAFYVHDHAPSITWAFTQLVEPITANRTIRRDQEFMSKHGVGCRVRPMIQGEFPPFGLKTLQDGTDLIVAIDVGEDRVRSWTDARDDTPLTDMLSVVLPPGPLYDRLKRLPQHERDRLMVSDRGLMCEVAATVWPSLGLKEDLPERFQPPPERHHASPKAHVRRGHWRRTPSGGRTWVQPAQIGSSKPRSFGPWSPGAVQCTSCLHNPGPAMRRCSVSKRYAGGNYWRRCASFETQTTAKTRGRIGDASIENEAQKQCNQL